MIPYRSTPSRSAAIDLLLPRSIPLCFSITMDVFDDITSTIGELSGHDCESGLNGHTRACKPQESGRPPPWKTSKRTGSANSVESTSGLPITTAKPTPYEIMSSPNFRSTHTVRPPEPKKANGLSRFAFQARNMPKPTSSSPTLLFCPTPCKRKEIPQNNRGIKRAKGASLPSCPSFEGVKMERDIDDVPCISVRSVYVAQRSAVGGHHLVPVSVLPERVRPIFGFPLFNAIQSSCFETVYNSTENLVVSAPTGSGKTAVFELAICSLCKQQPQGTYKIVYQAPTKALCAERKRDWEKKYRTLGLVCTELTGDTDQEQLVNVRNGDIIITTPEKWDCMTRRWRDHRKLLDMVRLFLIDEVHILKEARGATLEVVVSRMKHIGSRVRFIALSATVPNSQDIAAWLGKDSEMPEVPCEEKRFGEEYRPVKLQRVVYGYPATANPFVFDRSLDKVLPGVIKKHSGRKPTIVFCATRAICVSTAKLLADIPRSEMTWSIPSRGIEFKDKDLQVTAKEGVAFHHAGLDSDDRALVEHAYLEGRISVICSTSTLAVGVNLPAHLVIIKNTVHWSEGLSKEYMDLEVMQMLGRAGRPQFDNSGVGVILTRKESKEYYEKLETGTESLESCLHRVLIEHLNAEIGLGTVTSLALAKRWLRSTFLYVRLRKNPAHYNLHDKTPTDNVEHCIEEICERDIGLLTKTGLVRNDQSKLKCTDSGDAMALYYIKFRTMQRILEMQPASKLVDTLKTLSEAQEFNEMRLRNGEKALYKAINVANGVKYPISVEPASAAHKVLLLIQTELGMLDYPEDINLQKLKPGFVQDMHLVFQHCHRIAHCIVDCKLHEKDAFSGKSALELARCLKSRVWENSPNQLRQLEGVGPITAIKLVNAGIRSIEILAAADSRRIETILSRNPPFGQRLLKAAQSVPRFSIQVEELEGHENITHIKDATFTCVSCFIGLMNPEVPKKFKGATLYANFWAETSEGLLLDFKRFPVYQLEGGKRIDFSAELSDPRQTIVCSIVCEQLVDTMVSYTVHPNFDLSVYAHKQASRHPAISENQSRSIGAETSKTIDYDTDDDEYGGADIMAAFDDFDFSHIDKLEVNAQGLQPQDGNPASAGISNDNAIELPSAVQGQQLPNGKWRCRHRCLDRTKCKHLCCHEGLDKEPNAAKRLIASVPATRSKLIEIQHSLPKKTIVLEKTSKAGLRTSSIERDRRAARLDIVDLASDTSTMGKLQHLHTKYAPPKKATLSKKPEYSCRDGLKAEFALINLPSSPNVEQMTMKGRQSEDGISHMKASHGAAHVPERNGWKKPSNPCLSLEHNGPSQYDGATSDLQVSGVIDKARPEFLPMTSQECSNRPASFVGADTAIPDILDWLGDCVSYNQ